MSLKAEKDGAGLSLLAPNGYIGALGVTEDGPRLFFHDDKGRHREG